MAGLKPCPFCGEHPAIKKDRRYPFYICNGDGVDAYEVVCQNIDCIIYNADHSYYMTKEEAIEAWNRRANDERKAD